MKAYICHVFCKWRQMYQCSSFRIHEWSYDINGVSIFDFTVPYVSSFETPKAALPLSFHLARKILEAFVAIYWI